MFARHRAQQPAPDLRQSIGTRRQKAFAEALEARTLLSTMQLGEFSGRAKFDGRVSGPNPFDDFQLTLTRPALLTAVAIPTAGLLPPTLPRDIVLVGHRLEADGFLTTVGFSDHPGTASEGFHAPLGPGTYRVSVAATDLFTGFDPGTTYTLEIGTDFAGETIGAARDLGTLLATQTARDFVGTGFPADPDDFYKFSVIANGNFNATLSETSGNTNDADLVLIRDGNNNGKIDPLEVLATSTASGIGTEGITRNLNTGTYFARVTSTRPGTNYNLSLRATPTDNAGNTLTNAKDAGVLSSTVRNFNDFIGSPDTTDIYKFEASGGGPFAFSASLTGLAQDSEAKLELLGPSGNVITGSNAADNADERIDASLDAAGTYFVRVTRIKGDTSYNLALCNTNTDIAGDTLATALNHGALNGHFVISDSLSQTDPIDVIKFSLAAAGTISASFPALVGSADATLELLSSAGAILQSSVHAGASAESIVRAVPAGTYFVRVSRFNGLPRYTLTIAADAAGNTVANARPIRLGFDTIDYLDAADPVDLYKFTTTVPTRVSTFLSLLGNNVNLILLRDINKDGKLDPNTEVIASTNNRGTFPDQLNANLPSAGTYFLSAASFGGATDYGITFASSPIDNGGNTLATARDLGVLGATSRTFDDFVGAGSIPLVDDVDDFYRFTVGNAGPYTFSGQISNLTADADLELIWDDNLNNHIDPGESLVLRSNNGTASDLINLQLTVPGRYFLHVLRSSGNANYHLTMSATSTDTAPDSLLNAKNIGLLDSTLAQSEFVGAIDPIDLYKFGVTSPGSLQATLSGLTGDADIQIIRNTDGDNTVDAGEIIASGHTLGTGSELLKNINLPAAGTYFARILSASGDANYKIALTFTAAAQTVTLAPVADSFVRGGVHAAENHGTEGTMVAKKATADFKRESYLKFDISSFTTASSVKLRLFGKLSDATDASVQTSVFSALDNSWTETGIKDTNKPGASAAAMATTPISGTTGRFYEWDITGFVQAEKAAGHQFITLVLKDPNTSTSSCIFNTREAGSNRPQLVVTS